MNTKTNFYGTIGLISTIGKNGFALGQTTSQFSAKACYYTRQVIEVNLLGYNILENLEKATKKMEKFDKWAETKCQAWETWAQEKYNQAQAQEELNESWRKLNNQPTNLEKAQKLAQKAYGSTRSFLNSVKEYFPKNKLEKAEKVCYPNYLQKISGFYF